MHIDETLLKQKCTESGVHHFLRTSECSHLILRVTKTYFKDIKIFKRFTKDFIPIPCLLFKRT